MYDARTAFLEGRLARTFYEFSIPSGVTVVVRATVTDDIILQNTKITIDQSRIKLSLYAGGTEGGTWTPVTVYQKNNLTNSPPLEGFVSVDVGGTHSGGILLDVARIVSENVGNGATTVGEQIADERGVLPGTYYYHLENIDGATATGVFSAFWEEYGAG